MRGDQAQDRSKGNDANPRGLKERPEIDLSLGCVDSTALPEDRRAKREKKNWISQEEAQEREFSRGAGFRVLEIMVFRDDLFHAAVASSSGSFNYSS